MRLFPAVVLLFLFSSFALAQSNVFPAVLEPSVPQGAEKNKIFKLLPRDMFKDTSGSDEGNPIGIRGGGAYYSFTTGLHSYDKIPQIELDQDSLGVGFYGANYGFMIDLNEAPLKEVSLDLDPAKALVGYIPPTLESEIREEARKSYKYHLENSDFERRLPAKAGHTYLLRAISFDEADIIVAFQILTRNDDGSLEIAWKPLKTFAAPHLMTQAEADLRSKVDEILKDPRYADVRYTLRGEMITLTGSTKRAYYSELLRAVMDTGPRGLDNRVAVK